MTPEFHPAAQEELSAGVKAGEERAAGLGEDLLQEVRRAVGLLCTSPEIGRHFGGAISTPSVDTLSVCCCLSTRG
jgi:hypothetical protein